MKRMPEITVISRDKKISTGSPDVIVNIPKANNAPKIRVNISLIFRDFLMLLESSFIAIWGIK